MPQARLRPLLVVLIITLFFTVSLPALADTTYTVTNQSDMGAGSLRQAVVDANANPGHDTIVFVLPPASTITLTTGELAVTEDLTISGPGMAQLSISGNNAGRVINATAPLTVTGMTIRDGIALVGGGINATARVSVSDVHFITNTCTTGSSGDVGGGGLFVDSADQVLITNSLFEDNYSAGNYGAFRGNGTATITNVDFIDNAALAYGGAFSAKLGSTIGDSRFEGNFAGFDGGAIVNGGGSIISNTDFVSNTAGMDRGAISAWGDLHVSDSLFQGNKALSGSGGAAIVSGAVVITSTDFVSNTAAHSEGVAYIGGDVTISDSLFQGNQALGNNNGVLQTGGTLDISGSDFISNTAASWQGVGYTYDATTISDSLFQGNTCGTESNGVLWVNAGQFEISSSRFVGNRAGVWQGVGGAYGAIVVRDSEFINNDAPAGCGVFFAASDLDMDNCLVQESDGAESGAIWADGTTTITNTQFLTNTATQYGGALVLYGDATITGGSFENNLAVQAGGAVWAKAVVISGTQFISNTQTSEDDATYAGGAIYAESLASVENALFERNVAANYGGGIGTNYKGACMAVVTNTTFLSNTAISGGAVHAVDAVLSECTATGNVASHNGGAAVAEDGLGVVGGTYAYNSASTYGGALAAVTTVATDATFTGNAAGTGGAVIGESSTTVDGCTFAQNASTGTGFMDYGGGAVAGLMGISIIDSEFYTNTSAMAGGAAGTAGMAVVVSSTFQGNVAADTGGAICISATGTCAITDSTFEDNQSGLNGGAIFSARNAAISDCAFTGNVMTGDESFGGALFIEGGDSAVIDSTFQGNESHSMGGAIGLASPVSMNLPAASLKKSAQVATCIISNTSILSNTAFVGAGGVAVDAALLTMVDSTVAYNVADDGDGCGTGGGVQIMDAAAAYLTNCTIANNQAKGAQDDGGAGIMVYDPGENTAVHLTHCTISGNTSASDGGGMVALGGDYFLPDFVGGDPTFVMTGTLVAGNTAQGGSSPDVSGTIVSNQGNVVGDATGSTGLMDQMDQFGSALSPLDALLGDLGNYGGDTQTVPLLPGSPAIDCGGPSGCTVDQRGITRDWSPDSGAFESQGFNLSIYSGSNQSTPAGSQFVKPLVVAVSSSYGQPVDGGKVTYYAPQLGASATLDPDPSTIVNGKASTTATANDIIGGPYNVIPSFPTGNVSVSSLARRLTEVFTLTNTVPLTGEGAYSAGPDPVCPGHNVYNTMVVSNTSETLGMEGLVVTGTVPVGTEFYGDMVPADGQYDASQGIIVWALPEVAAGEQAVIAWTTHVLNGTPVGAVLTSTAEWSCDLLAGETFTQTVTVDDEGCTPPPPDPLMLSGLVYEDGGQVVPVRFELRDADGDPIPGATVTATTCTAGAWVDVTDDEGKYEIVIPGEAVEGCTEVTLTVYAEGYGEDTGTWPVAELRADGTRDWSFLPPEQWWVCLPLSFK